MNEKHTRFVNIQSKETSANPNQIENIFVSEEFENEKVTLILDNRGKNAETINIFYEEPDGPGSKTLEIFEIPSCSQQKVQLPKGFEKWKKLCFLAHGKKQSISNASLKKLSDKAKRGIKIDAVQSATEPPISESEQVDDPIDITGNDSKLDIETTNTPQRSTAYRQEAEITVQETWERLQALAQSYKDGEAIDFVGIENPTLSQKILMILNSFGNCISQWRNELENSREINKNLIETLTYVSQDIREKLKAIRGETPPIPNQLELDTDIDTDTELNEIRKRCACHVAWFEGRLFGYEERCEIDNPKEYDQFIPTFVKDRLFNGIARFLSFEQVPEQLDQILQLAGYAVIPIEIGKTKADARVHDIQGSQQTGVNPGTIVEVILPGLQRKVDGEIVQKPVVIRGE